MPKVMWLPCQLATRRAVRARRSESYLVIEAEGEVPHPDSTPAIVDVLTSDDAVEFELVRTITTAPSPGTPVPFLISEIFDISGKRPDAVVVRHADGEDKVEVEKGGRELAAFTASLSGESLAGEEATGFSRSLSFEEAFADALLRLPPADTARAERVVVGEVGALRGGGFDHLYVKVRREAG